MAERPGFIGGFGEDLVFETTRFGLCWLIDDDPRSDYPSLV